MKNTVISRAVIFLGKRNAALKAARTLGIKILIVDEKAINLSSYKNIIGSEVCSYQWLENQWREFARKLSKKYQISHVMGMVERAVLPAAIIRDELGLSGTSIHTALLCTNKALMKACLKRQDIPCADFIENLKNKSVDNIIDEIGFPLVLKNKTGSGGRGTLYIENKKSFPKKKKEEWIAEKFILGKEFSVESLVFNGKVVFVNHTSYLEPKWANLIPAGFDEDFQAEVNLFNQKVITALGIKQGITHLELFKTENGLVFGEIANRPPGGHIMELMTLAYEFDIWKTWLNMEIFGNPLPELLKASKYTAVRIIHPGEGIIKSIDGVEAIQKLNNFNSIKISSKPNDYVNKREGVGQEIGYLILSGAYKDFVLEDLENAQKLLKIEMVSPD